MFVKDDDVNEKERIGTHDCDIWKEGVKTVGSRLGALAHSREPLPDRAAPASAFLLPSRPSSASREPNLADFRRQIDDINHARAHCEIAIS